MKTVFFVSVPGERHEEHIPYGIFTDFDKMRDAIVKCFEENYDITPDEVVHYKEGTRFVFYLNTDDDAFFNVYEVPVDVFTPAELNT